MNKIRIPRIPRWLAVATLVFSLPFVRDGVERVLTSVAGQKLSSGVHLPVTRAWLICVSWLILYLTFRDDTE